MNRGGAAGATATPSRPQAGQGETLRATAAQEKRDADRADRRMGREARSPPPRPASSPPPAATPTFAPDAAAPHVALLRFRNPQLRCGSGKA